MIVIIARRIHFAFKQCICCFPCVFFRLFAFEFIVFNVISAESYFRGHCILVCRAGQARVLYYLKVELNAFSFHNQAFAKNLQFISAM